MYVKCMCKMDHGTDTFQMTEYVLMIVVTVINIKLVFRS